MRLHLIFIQNLPWLSVNPAKLQQHLINPQDQRPEKLVSGLAETRLMVRRPYFLFPQVQHKKLLWCAWLQRTVQIDGLPHALGRPEPSSDVFLSDERLLLTRFCKVFSCKIEQMLVLKNQYTTKRNCSVARGGRRGGREINCSFQMLCYGKFLLFSNGYIKF